MDQGGGSGRSYEHYGASESVQSGVYSCEELSFQTMLMSPQPAVIATLQPRVRLGIALKPVDGQDTVVALTSDGREVGAVNAGLLARLIKCLRDGHRYQAIVLEPLIGGSCNVLIIHANRS